MDEIKLLLRNTHDFEAERKFLLSKLEDCNGRVNEQIKARLDYVNEQLSTIQIWMTLGYYEFLDNDSETFIRGIL